MVTNLSRTALFLRFNVDKLKAKALVSRFHVRGIPTTIVVAPDGGEIDRIVGYSQRSKWTKTLLGYLYGIDTLQDLLNRSAADKSATLRRDIAQKYLSRGSAIKALAWVDKAQSALAPKDVKLGGSLSLIRGEALLETDPPEGRKLLMKIACSGPGDRPGEAFSALSSYFGRAANAAKNPTEKAKSKASMAALYDALLPKRQDNAGFLNDYAWHFAEEGIHLNRALVAAKRAVLLSKNKPGILDTLAEVYYKMGNRKRALETIEKAIIQKPASKYYKGQKEKFLEMKH